MDLFRTKSASPAGFTTSLLPGANIVAPSLHSDRVSLMFPVDSTKDE